MTALIDSGANISVIGSRGLDLLKKLNLPITSSSLKNVCTADGKNHSVLGEVLLPVNFGSTEKHFPFVLVPSVKHTVILGVDFCREFEITLDFATNSWSSRREISSISPVVHSRENLTPAQQSSLNSVIADYEKLGASGLGCTSKIQHVIDTGESAPIKQRQYPLSPVMMEHVNQELDKMLSLGVIQPSKSPWSSPILLVKKKSGEYRLCFDGRKLNAATRKDSYPLPRVDYILSKLGRAKYMSSIDLKSAFWQIPLSPESREKTAFSVPGRGLFEFVRMPFGLCNAPKTLQRLMDEVFGPELDPYVFVYLDDLVIVTATFEEHIAILCKVLDRLKAAGFTVNVDKCEFCLPSLKFLGFVVDQHGLRTDPDKVSAISSLPKPNTVTEVRRALGLFSWYRRFVPNFASMSAVITDLIKGKGKKSAITWNPAAEEAFNNLKLALISSPTLASPDYRQPIKPFVIYTDACNYGLGAVLTQKGDDGEEHPISYASRTLNQAERHYSATEKECLAVVFGILKFRPFIEGLHFEVITDHYSLLWLLQMQDPHGRLARWSVQLQQFNFKITHRPGKLHELPDALSRCPLEISALHGEDFSKTRDNWYCRMRENVTLNPRDYPDWRVTDNLLYKNIATPYSLPANLSSWKLVVPREFRKDIVARCHDAITAAHLGIFKTFNRVAEEYYWPKMHQYIAGYVKRCKVCLAQKVPQQLPPGFMGKEKVVRFPWQAISTDIIGPLPPSSSGNRYILVVTDWFSKFVLVHPMREANGSKICKFLEEQVFLLFGVPQIVMCDNGTQFTSKLFTDLIKKYEIPKLWYNAKFHPQVNFVERSNRVIKTAIRSYLGNNHRAWDKNLQALAQAIRTSVHEVTRFSPSFLTFGRHVPLSGNFYRTLPTNVCSDDHTDYAHSLTELAQYFSVVQERIHKAYERNAKYYNKHRRELEFNEGDIVYRRNRVLSVGAQCYSSALAPRYVPSLVFRKLSPLAYHLHDLNGNDAGIFHVKDLKPAPEDPELPSDLSDDSSLT